MGYTHTMHKPRSLEQGNERMDAFSKPGDNESIIMFVINNNYADVKLLNWNHYHGLSMKKF